MFRFTIRDVLWLTVVVALAVGWSLREWQFRTERSSAAHWRMRAGALEYALKEHGCKVTWRDLAVVVEWPAEYPQVFVYRHASYDYFIEPSDDVR